MVVPLFLRLVFGSLRSDNDPKGKVTTACRRIHHRCYYRNNHYYHNHNHSYDPPSQRVWGQSDGEETITKSEENIHDVYTR